ncbi:CD225/dispanin family protein [Nocardiopsis coralliicola]
MSDPQLPPGAASPRDEPPPRVRRTAPGSGGEQGGGGAAEERPTAPSGGASGSTMALILHALTFLCCANWIFGVIGIVFAVRAGHKRDRGLYAEAETLTRYSWYALGAAAVMVAVMGVLTLWMLTSAGSLVEGFVPSGVNY